MGIVLRIFTLILLIINPVSILSIDSDSFQNYPFLSLKYNYIQFYDKSSLKKFNYAIQRINERKLIVLHIGDSHLQNDDYPGKIRLNLQELWGYGGRGIMVPFSAAGTYSNKSYTTEHTGEWEFSKNTMVNPKIPLGVSGFSIKTNNPESTLSFNFNNPQPEHYKILKIFSDPVGNAFNIDININDTIVKHKSINQNKPFIKLLIPSVTDKIILKLNKNEVNQKELIFYGMSLESELNQGMIWHNCGVDGANFKSILRSTKFFNQAKSLKPDLIVIDLGTNDYAVEDILKPNLEFEMETIIEKLKKENPGVSIVLNSTQDMSYKGKNLSSGREFLSLIKKISKNQKIAFYNFFDVAGSEGSMQLWYENNLSRKDFIHLTTEGYHLKADLFSTALLNTIEILKNKKNNSYIID